MDLRQIDLNLMVAFEALMEFSSVSEAARHLGMSQPAMSSNLARLRLLFGDDLFVRSGRVMLPTRRATALQIPISQALAQLRVAINPPTLFEASTSRRVFNISGGDYAAMVILPHLAAYVAREAPCVDLRFRFVEKGAIPEWLDTGRLDLALGVFPNPPKRLALKPLFEENFVCLARRDHPALQDGMTLAAFTAMPHLLVTERGDATGAVDEALGKRGLTRRIALTVPHVLVLPSILPRSDMVATIGTRAANLFAPSTALAIHQVPLAMPPWRMSMMWSRQQASDVGLRWLRDILSQIGKAA